MSVCCDDVPVGPAPGPFTPSGANGPVVNFDPTTTVVAGTGGISVTAYTAVRLKVGGRQDAASRTFTSTFTLSGAADTVSGSVNGQAFGPVAVVSGDNTATAAAVAAAIDALTDVSASNVGAVISGAIAGVDAGEVEITPSAGTTTRTLVVDAETGRMRIYEREVPAGDANGWQLISTTGTATGTADYVDFDFGQGDTIEIDALVRAAAVQPYASDLEGVSGDSADAAYRAYATMTPVA